MSSQLIPPPQLAPPSVKHLPLEKRIELWAQLVDEADALVLAGLRIKIGPNGDLKSAYRDWYTRHMAEHDRQQVSFAENLSRKEADHGR
ncbi:MAG: hypothetical protein WD669_07225 [Pirellulales bacterium]